MNLLEQYKKFCDLKEDSESSNEVNLKKERFIFPTTLLPMINYMKLNNKKCSSSRSESLDAYIGIITNCEISDSLAKSYIPYTKLPKNQINANKKISLLFNKLDEGKNLGGQNAFKYMVFEMVDNIYQHSNFSNAYFMAQKYQRYLDVCFYDDGVGIPGSFNNANIKFKNDKTAIIKAIEGVSTKGQERGYGLSRNLKLIKQKFKGEMLVVSESGTVHLYNGKLYDYELSYKYKLHGTLVSYRYVFPIKDVNIYEYIE